MLVVQCEIVVYEGALLYIYLAVVVISCDVDDSAFIDELLSSSQCLIKSLWHLISWFCIEEVRYSFFLDY